MLGGGRIFNSSGGRSGSGGGVTNEQKIVLQNQANEEYFLHPLVMLIFQIAIFTFFELWPKVVSVGIWGPTQ